MILIPNKILLSYLFLIVFNVMFFSRYPLLNYYNCIIDLKIQIYSYSLCLLIIQTIQISKTITIIYLFQSLTLLLFLIDE